MTHIRQDPIAGHMVIISEGRAGRPIGVKAPENEVQSGWLCPFCEGNESTTPPELEASRDPGEPDNAPGWSLRVVPNKFSALNSLTAPGSADHGLFRELAGYGHHEVIIESPEHNAEIADYRVEKLVEVLKAYRRRIDALYHDSNIHYVQLFRNEGYLAGASLEHPHSQVLALPLIPPHIQMIADRSIAYLKKQKHCLACDLIKEERRVKERIVAEEGGFVAIAPYASRVPGEIAIFPDHHKHRFMDTEEGEMDALARILRRCIWGVKRLFDTPPFNLLLITSPRGNDEDFPEKQLRKAFHWHMVLLPRTTRPAGLEWGTGVNLNPMSPEMACRHLREAINEAPIPPGAIR